MAERKFTLLLKLGFLGLLKFCVPDQLSASKVETPKNISFPLQPLSYPIFSAGKGHVIRGWDEAIMKMTVGQTCGVYIESPWAYGKKGQPEAGIPPNQDLYFEVTLDRLG